MENYDTQIVFTIFSVPINWTIVSTWIVMAVLVLLALLAKKGISANGKTSRVQTAMEAIVLGMRDQIKEMSNDDPIKYLPLVGTFFLFIAMANILSIFPWFKIPTSSLSTTGAFAFAVLLAIPYYGIKNAGIKGYLKKYTEPTIFLLPMNVLSDFTSTLAMAIRLFGNMCSGVIIGSILMLLVPFILPLPMTILGLFSGFIQAYIFSVLTIIFVSAVSPVQKDETLINVRNS
ncbi:MAG: F0F1 ATP synthase subunit A [Alphaproteobacteria bacterium]|nr:F0F1 ATP synthase subunit A [Alphaproteobacteria bacterium]